MELKRDMSDSGRYLYFSFMSSNTIPSSFINFAALKVTFVSGYMFVKCMLIFCVSSNVVKGISISLSTLGSPMVSTSSSC